MPTRRPAPRTAAPCLRTALADLLDCVERLDPDGRGADDPVTDDEIDHAIAAARATLEATATPDPAALAVRIHD